MIGILAIQGDVIEHVRALNTLNISPKEVRLPKDLDGIKGLIIPGGESTTIMKLLKRFGLDKAIIKKYNQKKLSIYGTCAGAIILAKTITNHPDQPSLKLIDIEIQRNGYGRQQESFEQKLKILDKNIDCIFIRAPIIKNVGKDITIIKKLSSPIMVRSDRILITTFHPELTDNNLIHKYFVDMCTK